MKLTPPATTQNHTIRTTGAAMVCPVCGSGLFYPSERVKDGHHGWKVRMVCPECFAWQELTVDSSGMAPILERRIEGQKELAAELAELEHRHMAEECEKFIAALHRGAIQPIDF